MSQPHYQDIHDEDDGGVQPPPRALLWVIVGGFLLIVGGIVGYMFASSRPPLVTLFDTGLKGAVIITIALLLALVAFRKSLRWRFPVALIGVALAWMIGIAGFIYAYQNILAPGQRETVKSIVPFMHSFDPASPPPNTSLPTPVPSSGGISPDQLLGVPLLLGGSPTAQVATAIPPSETPPPTIDLGVTVTTVAILPSATPAPTNTPISLPTLPPTIAPVQPTAAPAAIAYAPSAHLSDIVPVKQTWNNCGPANVTMALSHYGWRSGQEVAEQFLRPSNEDKNVNPSEIVAFVNEQTGVHALTRIAGNMTILKQLLSNNIAVMIETGYLYEGSDWLGHYETVVGYEDVSGAFYIYDSWLGTGENGAGIPKPYNDFDKYWEEFNRTFIVIYTQENEALVRSILGDLADPNLAAQHAAEVARETLSQDRENAFAWFNLGTALNRMKLYDEAASAYDQARRLGTLPWRITWYQFGPFESYFNVGRYDDVMALVDTNLNNTGKYVEESHYWKGKVLAAQGDIAGARAAFKEALVHNSRYIDAQAALDALPAA